jgi:hypothetical protein
MANALLSSPHGPITVVLDAHTVLQTTVPYAVAGRFRFQYPTSTNPGVGLLRSRIAPSPAQITDGKVLYTQVIAVQEFSFSLYMTNFSINYNNNFFKTYVAIIL